MSFIGQTGCDVEGVGIACTRGGCIALSEDDLPERGEGERLAGTVGELAGEGVIAGLAVVSGVL